MILDGSKRGQRKPGSLLRYILLGALPQTPGRSDTGTKRGEVREMKLDYHKDLFQFARNGSIVSVCINVLGGNNNDQDVTYFDFHCRIAATRKLSH